MQFKRLDFKQVRVAALEHSGLKEPTAGFFNLFFNTEHWIYFRVNVNDVLYRNVTALKDWIGDLDLILINTNSLFFLKKYILHPFITITWLLGSVFFIIFPSNFQTYLLHLLHSPTIISVLVAWMYFNLHFWFKKVLATKFLWDNRRTWEGNLEINSQTNCCSFSFSSFHIHWWGYFLI